MAKKKEEGVEETTEAAAEEAAVEKKPKRAAKKADAAENEPSVVEGVIDTVASAAETVADAVVETVAAAAEAAAGVLGAAGGEKKGIVHKRAEKVGVVASDKMTKTVTVRVDRVVKHPTYRKYVRRRKKFMAHDELGAKVGDKVRIIETRPLSARKRWRVVEIIQKAEL
ncbi:MAG: 30S ribosomal protein S17 [Acidobacteria bacterium]|nr:30S ribosomal protein S17 [Acidobacteriota bacterium]